MKRNCFFLILPAMFFFSCRNNTPPALQQNKAALNEAMLAATKTVIHSGDIVMRSGKDFTSYRIRELSDNDKTYSHAGIALVKDTNVYIYHITPPDLDEPASDTAMRLEKIEKFADPSRCFGFGIIRYALSTTEINTALFYLDSLYKKKISFDHLFDLRDANQLYCSEMVDNILRYATTDRIQLQRKYFTPLQAVKAAAYFHLPMQEVTKRAYISIDAVELNRSAIVIHKYLFL